MISFSYFDITGSVPFDLPFSVITFFALAGFAFKSLLSIIYNRRW